MLVSCVTLSKSFNLSVLSMSSSEMGIISRLPRAIVRMIGGNPRGLALAPYVGTWYPALLFLLLIEGSLAWSLALSLDLCR